MTPESYSMDIEAGDSHPLLELSPTNKSALNDHGQISTKDPATTNALPQDHYAPPETILLTVQTSHQQNQSYPVSPETSVNLGSETNISSRRPSETSGVSGKAAPSTETKRNSGTKRPNRKLWAPIDRLICDTWLVEIASLVLSIGSLAAIIALLAVFDKKRLPDWPYQINLNALVSIFATILTSTLAEATGSSIGQLSWIRLRAKKSTPLSDIDLYDGATRGPWGAIILLLQRRSGLVGTIGVFVTIIALGVGPFVQQIISVSSESLPAISGQALVARSMIMNNGRIENQPVVMSSSDGGVNNAIYGGFVAGQHTSDLAQCSTGNCTWEPFPTLAVCVKCTNITEQIVLDNEIYYASQYGLALQYSYNGYNTGSINSSIHTVKEEVGTINATLIHISMIGRQAQVNGSTTGNNIHAEDCVLQYCVQVIQSDFKSGVFSEKILANFTQWESSYNLSSGSDPVETPDGFNNWPYPLNLTEKIGTSSNLSTNFSIDPWAFIQQRMWLETLLSVEAFFDEDEDLVYNGSDTGVVEAIYSDGIDNFSNTMNAMAESLSTQMRLAPSTGEDVTGRTEKTTGVALEMVAIVHVAWLWLILPAVVEVGGVIFVIATILLSSRSKAKLWKTSVLPLLFHGLDSDLRENTRALEELHKMEDESEKIKVRLGIDPLGGNSSLLKA